jgi:hypothetical protein
LKLRQLSPQLLNPTLDNFLIWLSVEISRSDSSFAISVLILAISESEGMGLPTIVTFCRICLAILRRIFLAGLFFIQTQPSRTTSGGNAMIGNLVLEFVLRRGLITVDHCSPVWLLHVSRRGLFKRQPIVCGTFAIWTARLVGYGERFSSGLE